MVSDLINFVWKWSKIAKQKNIFFFADFALQNVVETTLPDGLETSGIFLDVFKYLCFECFFSV